MLINRTLSRPLWTTRNPFGEMEALRLEMDRLLNELTGESSWSPKAGVFPMVNITEENENFYVRAEMPGIKADDMNISVTGKTLLIEGERKAAPEEEGARYHRRERETGTFRRIISFATEVDPEKVEASMNDGVLTITLPKSEKAKIRQISVKKT